MKRPRPFDPNRWIRLFLKMRLSIWRFRVGVQCVTVYQAKWMHNTLILGTLVIGLPYRGRGCGSRLVRDLQGFAATYDRSILLFPEGIYGGTKVQARRFYRKHGFRADRSRPGWLIWHSS